MNWITKAFKARFARFFLQLQKVTLFTFRARLHLCVSSLVVLSKLQRKLSLLQDSFSSQSQISQRAVKKKSFLFTFEKKEKSIKKTALFSSHGKTIRRIRKITGIFSASRRSGSRSGTRNSSGIARGSRHFVWRDQVDRGFRCTGQDGRYWTGRRAGGCDQWLAQWYANFCLSGSQSRFCAFDSFEAGQKVRNWAKIDQWKPSFDQWYEQWVERVWRYGLSGGAWISLSDPAGWFEPVLWTESGDSGTSEFVLFGCYAFCHV